MNVWNRLFTAVRGGLNELGETIADRQILATSSNGGLPSPVEVFQFGVERPHIPTT